MPARVRVDRLKPIYTAAKALNFGWRMSDFPSAPMQNGISRFIPQLHRLTIRFCKQSEASVGVRNFIENNLVEFSKTNPSVAVYVVPGRNCTPTIRAEYGNGRMVHMNSSGLSAERVGQYVNLLRTRSGLPIVRFESRQTASCKSVQGQWNPTTWIAPEQNAAQLPDERFSSHRTSVITATEYIQKLMKEKAEESK
ncbi:hypothetical protein QR680_009681 [Steinernema hermaphroditum]|uniref:Large ribosomal subunit protein mL43 n=1 Tax=Steinernema hermaphroditum TaxID=289476 RepID=A0AA39IL90_9BILA|nr:hypothetical protein QR680_009681 [Steinernema hermaphroditum]